MGWGLLVRGLAPLLRRGNVELFMVYKQTCRA